MINKLAKQDIQNYNKAYLEHRVIIKNFPRKSVPCYFIFNKSNYK